MGRRERICAKIMNGMSKKKEGKNVADVLAQCADANDASLYHTGPVILCLVLVWYRMICAFRVNVEYVLCKSM